MVCLWVGLLWVGLVCFSHPSTPMQSARYDIAGFVSIISDWPITDQAILRYKEDDEWKETTMSTINLIVTNLSYLGNEYIIKVSNI